MTRSQKFGNSKKLKSENVLFHELNLYMLKKKISSNHFFNPNIFLQFHLINIDRKMLLKKVILHHRKCHLNSFKNNFLHKK